MTEISCTCRICNPENEPAPTPNIPLLRKVAEWAISDYESRPAAADEVRGGPRWDQGDWQLRTECGTTMCFAGYTAYLGGCQVRNGTGMLTAPDGEVNTVSSWAARALGLTHMEQEELFFGTGTDPAALRRILTPIFGRAGEELGL